MTMPSLFGIGIAITALVVGSFALLAALALVERDGGVFRHPRPYLQCAGSWGLTILASFFIPNMAFIYFKSWATIAVHAATTAICFRIPFWRAGVWTFVEFAILVGLYLGFVVAWIIFRPWFG